MLTFSEKKNINKNDVIDGWATIVSCQRRALQRLKIKLCVNCMLIATCLMHI